MNQFSFCHFFPLIIYLIYFKYINDCTFLFPNSGSYALVSCAGKKEKIKLFYWIKIVKNYKIRR